MRRKGVWTPSKRPDEQARDRLVERRRVEVLVVEEAPEPIGEADQTPSDWPLARDVVEMHAPGQEQPRHQEGQVSQAGDALLRQEPVHMVKDTSVEAKVVMHGSCRLFGRNPTYEYGQAAFPCLALA